MGMREGVTDETGGDARGTERCSHLGDSDGEGS